MTTVWMSLPYVKYPRAPAPPNKTATTPITIDSTPGNFLGSFIDSVMGITLVISLTCGAQETLSDSQPNTLERKDRCSDQKREVGRIEHGDIGYSACR